MNFLIQKSIKAHCNFIFKAVFVFICLPGAYTPQNSSILKTPAHIFKQEKLELSLNVINTPAILL